MPYSGLTNVNAVEKIQNGNCSIATKGILVASVVRQSGPVVQKKVQVGKDQEKAQSEKDSHSKNRGGKKPK